MKFFSKDNYISLIVISFLLGVFAILVMQKSQFFMTLSDFFKKYIEIITVVVSPLTALWVADIMRKRTDKNKEENEVLRNLISYRHQKGSSEFLSAINRIALTFDKNGKIKQQVKELWRSYTNKENPVVSRQKEIELVYEICKCKGYDISEFEIDNFFVSDGPIVTPVIQIMQQQNPVSPQDPNSTASISNNNKTNCITSGSTTSNL